MFKIRKSKDRGFVNHGWLKSYHTFSFADYFDRSHINFGNLRVINEDTIIADAGFDKHPHSNMEIITYLISGALAHEDSIGNVSVILPGEVQVMSAGSGIIHSEFNQMKNSKTHLLQIWILPKEKQITPRYEQKSFIPQFRKSDFVLIVSGSGAEGSLKINQDAEIFAAKFSSTKKYNFSIKKNHKIWIQVIFGELAINDFELEAGDGIAVENESVIELSSTKAVEFLLFDLA